MLANALSPTILVIAVVVGFLLSSWFALSCATTGYSKKIGLKMTLVANFVLFASSFLVVEMMAVLVFGIQDISEVFKREILK